MRYAYWLDHIPEIGAGKIRHLYKEVPTAEEIYHLPKSQLEKIAGLKPEDVDAIENSRKCWDVEKEWFHLMEKGIGFVSVEQDSFPEKVRNIPGAPYALYYVGNLPDETRKSIAIVGARGRSAYGSEVTRHLAKALSERGVQIISGLAKGIDTDAHKGALDGGGETFAVLGCGVDICYPQENRYLYQNILESGGIISEYPPGTPPIPRQFPPRNRIISAFSDCVVVMEAKERSGSLITADFAMEQGRDVYALPGRITDNLSKGCNQLIKQGAGILSNIEEFLEEWSLLTEMSYSQMDFRKNLLEKDECLVYSLTDFRPIGLTTLIDKTDFSVPYMMGILKRLEDLGMIKETFANYYVRTFS